MVVEMKKSLLKRVFSFVRPYRIFLLGAIVSAVISVAFTLLAPVLVGDAIDFIIGPGNVNFPAVLRLLVFLVCSILLASGFQFLLSLCTNKIAYRTVRDIRMQLFRKINTVPLKYIDGHSHGDLISRLINDIDAMSDGLLQGMTQLFTGVATILGTLIFMLSLNPAIALVVVLITPLSMFVAAFIAKLSNKMFREQAAIQGQISGFVSEMVGEQKVVKAFSYEERSKAKFREMNGRLKVVGAKAQFYSSLSNPCTRFVNGLVSTAVGVIGALNVIRGGGMTVGQISCFLNYANQYTKPFNDITAIIQQIQTAFAAAQRVFSVLDEPSEPGEPKNAKALSSCRGRVEMEHVFFGYTPQRTLIQDFNLSVEPGQRIAIVGPTGCGKTTLINLLMRFYDVEKGTIRVDSVPIREMQRDSLRKLYGMVLQETWLYSATVRENIAYGKPDATQEEIVAAAKAAHAHSFIKRLPQGYDTIISENGGNISQGQKQLLCIARVMLVDPPMLILDEATSNIDTITEIRVQKAFARMMEGRTSFVVAHRLSTIKEADKILVMRDGNIIEQGKHEELLEKKGFYANLYRSQFAKAE